MSDGRYLTIAEQVANDIREKIRQRYWEGVLPGLRQMANELSVNFKTIEVSLDLLENEGLLESQGKGRPRKIVRSGSQIGSSLRVGIQFFDSKSRHRYHLEHLHNRLRQAGHIPVFPARNMYERDSSSEKMARQMKVTPADAWIIVNASQEVLNWVAEEPIPAFALYGRRRGLPLAGTGPDKEEAYRAAVRRLLELGHKRIVMLSEKIRRYPTPGYVERAFLEELQAEGISTGSYHLPDFRETPAGVLEWLDLVFRHTPPTAIIADTPDVFLTVQSRLSQQGIHAPKDISLVCGDYTPDFDWIHPQPGSIQLESKLAVRKIVNRILSWVNNIARCKSDRRQSFIKASFIEGETIGPVPRLANPGATLKRGSKL